MATKSLKHPCHRHPLVLRTLSENCQLMCNLCMLDIHDSAYCCEGCDYFLHESCAVLELPPEIRHPCHPEHSVILSGHRDHTYSCRECPDFTLHALTAIATLPPEDEVEKENEDQRDKEVEEEVPHEDNVEKENEDAEEDEHKKEVEEEEEEVPPEDKIEEEEVPHEDKVENENEDAEEDEHKEEVEEEEEEVPPEDKIEEEEEESEEEEEEESEDEVEEEEEESEDEVEEEEEESEDEVEEEEEESEDEVKEEGGIIRHFAHEDHPLASFHVEIPLLTKCRGCQRRISGQVYGCRACLFLIHASCARSSQQLAHPFGWLYLSQHDADPHGMQVCTGCEHRIKGGFVYTGTRLIKSTLHMACALSIRFRDRRQTYSNKFKMYDWHSCPLYIFYIEEETCFDICCKACDLKISGEAHGCPDCRFFLHESCAENLPHFIYQHFLHVPDHYNLMLKTNLWDLEYQCCCENCLATPPRYHSQTRMAFQCQSCSFYLNPSCALQTLSAVKEGTVPSVLHFAHDHPLQLHFIRMDYSQVCIACHGLIDGIAYCCAACPSIRLHKSCAELPKELEHSFHSQHPLVLLSKASDGYFHCSACRLKSTGFAYYCAECEFYLDVGCASLNPTLKHPRHEHRLAYFKSTDDHQPCNACGRTCKKDLYLCVPCGFRLHHDCLPLPHMIKHEGHRLHPVYFKDKFVDGDPNYQYCDHCEELRNPEQGVYRCEECGFSAHIHCMISKDKDEVEAEETEVKAAETEEPKGTESSEKPVADQQTNPKVELIRAKMDVMMRNIEAVTGNLAASMKKLEELQMEREAVLLLRARE